MRTTRKKLQEIEVKNSQKIEAIRQKKAIRAFYTSEHGERFLEIFVKHLEALTGADMVEYVKRFDYLKTMVWPEGFDPDVDAFNEAYDRAFWEAGDPLLDIYDALCS